MQDTYNCPLCSSTLDLKQINLTSAVYICTHPKCPYPVNEDNCILVKRRLRDINKPLSIIRREWELKHIKTEEIKQPDGTRNSIESSVESSPSMVSDADLFPMQEIDDLLNSLDTFNPKPDSKPTVSQDLKAEDPNDLNLDAILRDVIREPQINTQVKSESTHSFGDELKIVQMSDAQYQDMDNFLMDLLN